MTDKFERYLELQNALVPAQPNHAADDVNHPVGYTHAAIEAITLTEQLPFCMGNAIKYAWRHEHKGSAAKDLRKAAWYVRREAGRAKRLWFGARLFLWWKLYRLWKTYAEPQLLPPLVGWVLTDLAAGEFEQCALYLEGLATLHEG